LGALDDPIITKFEKYIRVMIKVLPLKEINDFILKVKEIFNLGKKAQFAKFTVMNQKLSTAVQKLKFGSRNRK